jgi:hypothetical protein
MRLFSYCIPVDDGAAPNPFGGVCTLAICKPVIRRISAVGDWIVGTGGSNVLGSDYSGRVVYAMRITNKMTMEEYDAYTSKELKIKVPDWHSRDIRKRLGDSVYDFGLKASLPTVRESVHNEKSRT